MTAADQGTTYGHAPGKLILAGEHAAVAGDPVVAAALSLRCTTAIEPRADELVELCLPDLGVRRTTDWCRLEQYATAVHARWRAYTAHPTADGFAAVRGHDPAHVVAVALGETLRHLPTAPGGARVTVRSTVPLCRGMGSSAATAIATIGALLAHFRTVPDTRLVERLATRTERSQHGLPSGIDIATTLRGGVLRLTRSRPGGLSLVRLPVAPAALSALEVYDTGPAAEPTGEVVTAVRSRLTPMARAGARRATDLLCTALTGTAPDYVTAVHAIRRSEEFLEGLGIVPAPVRAAIRTIESHGGAAKVCGAGSLRGPGAGALLVLRPASDTGPEPPFTRLHTSWDTDGLRWETT